MAAAGSNWTKHSKANSRGLRGRTREFGSPPHPIAIRKHQRFAPRSGRSKWPFRVTRVARDGSVHIEREDPRRTRTTMRGDRLLETRADGHGLNYLFLGFRSPARHATTAYVVAVEDVWSELRVPEWHPRRPVVLATAQIPEHLRAPGAWVGCSADLGSKLELDIGQDSGGHLAGTLEVTGDPDPAHVEWGRALLAGGRRDHRAPRRAEHPREVRPGQAYVRRGSRSPRLIVLDERICDGRALPFNDGRFAGQAATGGMVIAFNGRRRVRLDVVRLLARDASGAGAFYEYRGGGQRATKLPVPPRRRRARRWP